MGLQLVGESEWGHRSVIAWRKNRFLNLAMEFANHRRLAAHSWAVAHLQRLLA